MCQILLFTLNPCVFYCENEEKDEWKKIAVMTWLSLEPGTSHFLSSSPVDSTKALRKDDGQNHGDSVTAKAYMWCDVGKSVWSPACDIFSFLFDWSVHLEILILLKTPPESDQCFQSYEQLQDFINNRKHRNSVRFSGCISEPMLLTSDWFCYSATHIVTLNTLFPLPLHRPWFKSYIFSTHWG